MPENRVAAGPGTDINSAIALVSMVFLAVVGPQAVVVQPAFVEGLVSQLGFSPVQAGYVSAAENTGKAVMSIAMMFLVTRVNWRYLFYAALLALIGVNLFCTVFQSYHAFLAARAVNGLANGIIVPLCYVVIGLTAKSERNYGIMMVFVLLYSAGIFLVIPTLFQLAGFNGLLFLFTGFAVLALPLVRNLPVAGEQEKHAGGAGSSLSWILRGMAIAAMFFFFLAMFSLFPYLSLIGSSAGIAAQTVANAQTVAQFCGMGGAFLVVVIGDRFGRALPIATALSLIILSIAVLGHVPAVAGFTIAVCLFMGLWSFVHPFILAAQARFDRSGRQVTYATALQMMGIASGPAIAARILEVGGGYNHIMLVAVLFLLITLACILPPVIRHAALARQDQD